MSSVENCLHRQVSVTPCESSPGWEDVRLGSERDRQVLIQNELIRAGMFRFLDQVLESCTARPPTSLIIDDCSGRWIGLVVREMLKRCRTPKFETIFYKAGATHVTYAGLAASHADVSKAGDRPLIVSDCFERGIALTPLRRALATTEDVRVAILSCLSIYRERLHDLFGRGVIACDDNQHLQKLLFRNPLLNGVCDVSIIRSALAFFDSAFVSSPTARKESPLDTLVSQEIRKGRELITAIVDDYLA